MESGGVSQVVEEQRLVGEVADEDGEDAIQPHVFSSIYAFVKLERLKLATTKMNHFAIRSSVYLKAIRASYEELRRMRLPDVGLKACA